MPESRQPCEEYGSESGVCGNQSAGPKLPLLPPLGGRLLPVFAGVKVWARPSRGGPRGGLGCQLFPFQAALLMLSGQRARLRWRRRPLATFVLARGPRGREEGVGTELVGHGALGAAGPLRVEEATLDPVGALPPCRGGRGL